MGISTYNSPTVHGFIKDNSTGETEMMNSPRVQAALVFKGNRMIELAKMFFLQQSQHEAAPPVYYLESFEIKHVMRGIIAAIEVWNTDTTAEWVEFGAHAGGETPVLRYRPFGRAADVLEAEAVEEGFI